MDPTTTAHSSSNVDGSSVPAVQYWNDPSQSSDDSPGHAHPHHLSNESSSGAPHTAVIPPHLPPRAEKCDLLDPRKSPHHTTSEAPPQPLAPSSEQYGDESQPHTFGHTGTSTGVHGHGHGHGLSDSSTQTDDGLFDARNASHTTTSNITGMHSGHASSPAASGAGGALKSAYHVVHGGLEVLRGAMLGLGDTAGDTIAQRKRSGSIEAAAAPRTDASHDISAKGREELDSALAALKKK